MVTLMLVAMCGILGLAVDLGWSFFVKKSAQAAADAAALSAVAEGKTRVTNPPFTCGNSGTTTIYCTPGAPVDCSTIAATSNLYNACQYATENGFTSGGNTTVTVDADVVANRPPPTVTGVTTYYWVTVRVSRRIPQLFSAVMGNREGIAASRATAALADVIFDSSLDLLNRQNDPNPDSSTGVNLDQQGNGTVEAPGGMLLASNIPGAARQGGQ
jgi:Flp pilus assembly protein TadG